MNTPVVAKKQSARGNSRRMVYCLGCCITVFLTVAGASPAHAQEEVLSLAVLADSSLALPINRAIRSYAAGHNVAVSAAFSDLADLEHQAIEGTAYDVLITASPTLLTSLKQQGVVDLNSEADITTGRLVLVTSAKNLTAMTVGEKFPANEIIAALDFQPGLLLGNPETLYQGTVAREALKSYGVADDLEPYIIYEKSLDEILETVSIQGSYAIVYATDAAFDSRLRILGGIPVNHHQPIQYKTVALAGEKMAAARQFISYLRQSEARTYLEH